MSTQRIHIPTFYSYPYRPGETQLDVMRRFVTQATPVVLVEDLSDQEAREYADSLTRQEAREHLAALMNSSIA